MTKPLSRADDQTASGKTTASVTAEPTSRPTSNRVAHCGWCGGSGIVTAERNFLLTRLKAGRDHRWIGSSADALVVAAMSGQRPVARPWDGWDLGRCLITQAVAPPELAAAMQPTIDEWTALIEREHPHWGVDAARKMLAEHVDEVQALVAR